MAKRQSSGEREFLADVKKEARRKLPAKKVDPRIQQILELAEKAQRDVWGDNSIEDVLGSMEDLIALAVQLGAVESPEDES